MKARYTLISYSSVMCEAEVGQSVSYTAGLVDAAFIPKHFCFCHLLPFFACKEELAGAVVHQGCHPLHSVFHLSGTGRAQWYCRQENKKREGKELKRRKGRERGRGEEGEGESEARGFS